ncbi:MAG: BatA domain-containing protein, partial [Bacteroidia bacterium]
MMFVYPTFLWALLAIAIPIIIHLFNFRRYKKVYFTNVKFLKELRHESKSKSRLKEILILAARCLAIASLVIAFCQPVAVTKNTKLNPGANAISIYIDNSFSMENVQKQGPLLSIAQLRAKDIVKAYGNADKFQLITNDFEGKHQRFYTKDDILNAIEEVKISPSVRQLSSVIKRQNEFLQSSGAPNKKIYAVSDAQRSTFDFETLKNDTTIKISLVPLSANQVNNVYVDSCWFETPLQQKGFIQKLHATIVNTGNSAINAGSAKLFLNKQQLALSSFSVEAGSKKEILFTFECKQSGFN